MKWQKYDPEWLVVLAEEQLPEEAWLPTALRACTSYSVESKSYYYFVNREDVRRRGTEWQFKRNLFLHDKKEGELVLDVLEHQKIGGLEFLARL